MGSIQTSIQLNDLFSGVMNNIVSSIDMALVAMQNIQQVMNADIDTSSFENTRNEIDQTVDAFNRLSGAVNSPLNPRLPTVSDDDTIDVDVNPIVPNPLVDNPEPIRADVQPPAPVRVPIEWETDGLEVFTGTGVERFQQEVNSANHMLNMLNSTQARISQTAQNMDILPDAAVSDMNAMQQRLNTIQQKIQQISNNPVNVGSSAANTELERLRAQLNRALQEQRELNSAMRNMDPSAANNAYLRLSQTISNTERYIRDNVNAQGQFNHVIQEGTTKAGSFVKSLMGLSLINSVINLVKGQMGSAISRMDTMTNYNRTMTAITGSADMASASLDQLKEITKGTAYGLDTAAKATQNFVTRGMNIGSASAEVGKWADAVAFYGDGTNESLMTVTDALGKMLSKGTVEMEQLNRLTDNGINAVGIYAEATGQSTASVQDDLSNGVISAQDFITTVSTAFTEGTNGVMSIAGAAKEAGGTWATSISNAKAAITRGLISVINGINEGLANAGFGTLLDGITEFGVQVENVLNNIGNVISQVITWLSPVLNLIADIAGFISNNWSVIEPIIFGIAAALAIWYGKQLLITLATKAYTLALKIMEAAQAAFNAVMSANPAMILAMALMILIGIIIAVANHIVKTGDTATTAFGVICGWVFVAGAAFKNLGMLIANIALGIWSAMKACVENMRAAFHNVISNIKSWFYSLISTVLTVIGSICEALNKLPFISFDYSGITAAADDYAAKASAAANNKMEYTSVADAYKEGSSKFQAFQDGWAKDAYNAGANFGDNVWSKFKDRFSQDKEDDKPQVDLPQGFSGDSGAADGGEAGGNAAKTAANTGDTADNTAAIAKSLDITNEELKYLRDIAERDTVNRFTTASIKVEMTNHNRIDSKQDLDGIVSTLTSKIENAMSMSAEGVHV